jgi:hypothetical protein
VQPCHHKIYGEVDGKKAEVGRGFAPTGLEPWINDTIPAMGVSGINGGFSYSQANRQLTITANVGANTMQVVYGDFTHNNIARYDLTANIAQPATFRLIKIRDVTDSQGFALVALVSKLQFSE